MRLLIGRGNWWLRLSVRHNTYLTTLITLMSIVVNYSAPPIGEFSEIVFSREADMGLFIIVNVFIIFGLQIFSHGS